MDKRGEESGVTGFSWEIVKTILIILGIVLVLFPLGKAIYTSVFGKDLAAKKSFDNLIDELDAFIIDKEPIIVPLLFTDRYDLVIFGPDSLSAGRYEKPPECGLEYCLVLCKSGLISLKDNCKNPIRYKTYNDVEFYLEQNKPVLVNGKITVVSVEITTLENKIYIKQLS